MPRVKKGPGPSPLEQVVLDPLEIELDAAEALRYLGYPEGTPPRGPVLEKLDQAIAASRRVQRPRGMYAIYRVARHSRRSLTLRGGTRFAGSIGEFLGNADRAAVFVATAGPEVVALAENASLRGDRVGNLVFHALGAQLAEAAVDRIVDSLRERLGSGEALTLRYSPGYCGISLLQQRTVFQLIDAARLGVELLPSLIMKPVKSVSGLIGLGPQGAVQAYGNPCDRCPLPGCRMRR